LHSTAVFLYNRCKMLFCSGLFVITVVRPIYISLSPTRSTAAASTSTINELNLFSSSNNIPNSKKLVSLSYLTCSIYLYPSPRAGSKERTSERGSGKDSSTEQQRQWFGAAATAVQSGNLI
jgi:hypothetical protein